MVLLNRAVASVLLWALARHEALSAAFTFTGAPIQAAGTDPSFLLPDYYYNEVFGRSERFVSLKGYPHWQQAASRLVDASYAASLEVLGTDDPHALFQRLLSVHLLRPVAPWRRNESNPLWTLGQVLERVDHPLGQAVAERLRGAAQAVDDLAGASGPERLARIELIREIVSDVLHRVGAWIPTWLNESPVVYEDAPVLHSIECSAEHLREDLTQLATIIRQRLIRSHLADALRDRFVSIFGEGGRCTNVVQFLRLVAADHEECTRLLADCLEADVTALADSARPDRPEAGGGSALPPSASLFFQIAAKDEAALRAGEYLLVVNQDTGGHVGTLLRSARVAAPEHDIHGELRRWLGAIAGDRTLLQLPVYSEWNTLQYQALPDLPVIAWPTESPTADPTPTLPLHSLRLLHDAQRKRLDLQGPNGEPIVIQYLGVVPQHVITGPLRLLVALTDPWFLGQPAAKIPGRGEVPEQIEFHPRVQQGRIVFERAYWRVPPKEFPTQSSGETDWAFFQRAERWRREHQLPSELFVSTERRKISLAANQRKPVWFSFASLHSLLMVGQMVTNDVVALRLKECLPSRSDHWVRGQDGLSRASEFVALVRWSDVVEGA